MMVGSVGGIGVVPEEPVQEIKRSEIIIKQYLLITYLRYHHPYNVNLYLSNTSPPSRLVVKIMQVDIIAYHHAIFIIVIALVYIELPIIGMRSKNKVHGR